MNEDEVKLNVGPGLTKEEAQQLMSNVNKELSPDYAKQTEEMKKFMSSTVEELAASDKESLGALEILDVRGRKMVISKKRNHARTSAVMVACLYALKNPEVDSILLQSTLTAHFMTPEGIEIQPFIENKGEVSISPKPATPPDDGKRNILVPDDTSPP